MRVALSGGEKGSYRRYLLNNGVPCIALNITQYTVPKTKDVNLRELLGGADVIVYTSDGDEDVEKFDSFVRTHADDISAIIGRPDYNGDWLGDKYLPLWNDEHDVERLAYLCQKYGRAAISDRAINGKTLPRIRQLQQRWGATLYGITSKVDTIETLDWDTVIVSSWTSVIRYGETQVWDGHALRRYPAQKKETARQKHRNDIVRLGVDYGEVSEGDVSAIANLAIKSWLEWQKQSGIGAYHPPSGGDEDEFDTPETGQIATMPPSNALSPFPVSGPPNIATGAPESRHESERLLLPVIGMDKVISRPLITTPDGDEVLDSQGSEVTIIKSSGSTIRNCDSCYLASRCPAFKEHSECAYKIPVELKTKEQLRSALSAILEMQTSRILFARFAEELEGQGMDPLLSQEMDRLFKLVKEFKDIEDTRDLIRFEMEAKGSSGVLSRIFGEKATEKMNTLSRPVEVEEFDQFVFDAEVMENNE